MAISEGKEPVSNPLQQPSLSHLDSGGTAHMVDVSDKAVTQRTAVAEGYVRMAQETLKAVQAGNLSKGDVLGTARIAGIMAAKQTSNLIPLCHPLPIKTVEISLVADCEYPGYRIQAMVKTAGQTGVEMEALTAVSVTALTLYDMAKALQKSMQIERIRLISKTGGKSGDYTVD
ncbi:MAG: cyclic pyranopterin monophosphate synthase MoaC [Symploca sp. SIO2G7]|nr:cyclic pyranopterin monophosphate synthase MoaC [Symploca sp. SIO2G7]